MADNNEVKDTTEATNTTQPEPAPDKPAEPKPNPAPAPVAAQGGIYGEVYETIKVPSAIALYWREIKRDKVALVSFAIFITLLLTVIIASPFIGGAAATEVRIDPNYSNRAPSWQEGGLEGFLLGTDLHGRNMIYMLIVGARNSIFIGFSVSIIGIIIGFFIGIFSGYYGGHVDGVIMRFVDTWTMMPGFMMIVALIQLVDGFSIFYFILFLTMFSWMGRTRLIRGGALQQRNMDYVAAGKTVGSRNLTIMFRDVAPNLMAIIVPNIVLTMSTSIGMETGLTILGFGLPPGTPSLGTIIANATVLANLQNRWWVWFPGILLLFILMLSINFIGSAVQRAADPRQRLS